MPILDKDGEATFTPATLAVVIPVREDCTADFTFDFGRFMAYMGANWMARGHRLVPLISKGTLISSQRQELAEKALESGADFILWLDSDMRFPKDVFFRLAAHNKHIVGCNYSTRKLPLHPTAHAKLATSKDAKHQYCYTTPESTGLEEVQSMGFGCVLTHSSVFESLGKPYFAILWSTVAPDEDGGHFVGEDVFFCHRVAEELGLKLYIDHDLSKQIGHEGRMTYLNQHAFQFKPDIDRLGPPGVTVEDPNAVSE